MEGSGEAPGTLKCCWDGLENACQGEACSSGLGRGRGTPSCLGRPSKGRELFPECFAPGLSAWLEQWGLEHHIRDETCAQVMLLTVGSVEWRSKCYCLPPHGEEQIILLKARRSNTVSVFSCSRRSVCVHQYVFPGVEPKSSCNSYLVFNIFPPLKWRGKVHFFMCFAQ